MVYVAFMLALALLLWLGHWQWRRGMEKVAIESALEETDERGGQYTTLDSVPPNWQALAYQRVQLRGAWRLDAVFLLANRVRFGQLGFEVFSPFQLAADNAVLLINRGWIPAPRGTAVQSTSSNLQSANRESTAKNDLVTDMTADLQAALIDLKTTAPALAEPRGRVYLPEPGFTLGEAYRHQAGWPKIIQYVDLAALAAPLGSVLQPAAMALTAEQAGAFAPLWHEGWQKRAFRSSRHFGYAAQWWGLAVVWLVFGGIWQRMARRAAGGRR